MKKIFLLFFSLFFLGALGDTGFLLAGDLSFKEMKNLRAEFMENKKIRFENYTYLVKPGDTFFKISGKKWETVARLNRISEYSLLAGIKILVPLDIDLAEEIDPLPKFLNSRKKKLILINLNEQALGIYENGSLIDWFPISTGRKGLETPTGDFFVRKKDDDHVSSSYPKPHGGAPMPDALDFLSGLYWIHGGDLPGFPASHGCVRLSPEDARKLYVWSDIKTPVKIVDTNNFISGIARK